MDTDHGAAEFRLQFFGGAAVHNGCSPLPGRIAQPRPIAVLALLAEAGPLGVPRDRLAAMLWAGEPEARARHHLSDTLYIIRHAMGGDAIHTTRQLVCLNEDRVACDVCAFVDAITDGRPAAATELYTGAFLDGFHVDDAREFTRWCEEQRTRLSQMYAGALETAARSLEDEGRYPQASRFWAKATLHDPYNSRLAIALARVLVRSEESAKGLQVLKHHVATLARDLEIEPDPTVSRIITNGGWERFVTEHASCPAVRPVVAHPPPDPGVKEKVPHPAFAGEPPLASPPVPAPRPRMRRRSMIPSALGASAVVLVAVFSGWRGGSAPPASFTIAIQPFTVEDAELDPWAEGLPDVIAWKLDGVGPLQVVSRARSSVNAGLTLDRSALSRAGAREGARFVIAGGVYRAGPDSALVRSWLLDTETDETIRERNVVVRRSGIVQASDSVAADVLATLARERGLALVGYRSLGSSDPLAIRAFIAGDWSLRRLALDSAIEFYRRAIEHDSGFALAYSHWALAIRRRTADRSGNTEFPRLQLTAGRLNAGLASRESLLLVIDSIDGVFWTLPRNEVYREVDLLNRYRRTLGVALQSYPNDQQVWFRRAEALIHWSPQLPGTHRDIYGSIARVLALDSAWIHGYEHALQYVTLAGAGPEETLRVIAAYRRHLPEGFEVPGHEAAGIGLLERYASGDLSAYRHHLDSLALRAARDVYLGALWYVHNAVAWTADSAEIGLDLIRRIDGIRRQGAQLWVAGRLLYHGRLDEARAFIEERALLSGDPMMWLQDLTYFGAIPPSDDLLDAARSGVSFDELRRTGFVQGVFAAVGDTATLRRVTALWDSAMTLPDSLSPGVDAASREYYRRAAHGYLALARGDSAAALRMLMPLERPRFLYCSYELVTTARLLMGYRRWAEADRTLRVCASSNPIFGAAGADVYIRLLWAQTLDALGRIDDALDAYRFVDAAWRRADPALRPYHAVAADAVRRLAGEERLPATSRRYAAVP